MQTIQCYVILDDFFGLLYNVPVGGEFEKKKTDEMLITNTKLIRRKKWAKKRKAQWGKGVEWNC